MKTDRELLELAAKAAGYDLEVDSETPVGRWNRETGTVARIFWNPLNEDGDTLRLANELQISIRHTGGTVVAKRRDSGAMWEENYCGDIDAATRRAVVLVAAMLGAES